jgi:hypothetical protein
MNLLSIKSHGFCLHNSFLNQLKLEYFSSLVRAVPPKETGRGSFTTLSSLPISLTISLSEKPNCDVSPWLPITFILYVKASFPSTCPAYSALVVLVENWINTKYLQLFLPTLRTIHQPQASRWCTRHQWVMKSCSWKDENLWYSW